MSVLTPEMQLKLKEEKISTRIQNELYLRKHPEVKDILHYVMNQVLLTHPEDVIQSAVDILADADLKAKVDAHKDSISKLGQLD